MNKRLDITYIRKYVEGKLSPREMFELEKAAQADEMLMDIILGLESEKAADASPNVIKEINHLVKAGTLPDRVPPTRIIFPIRRMGIAATFLITMGIGAFIWINQSTNEEPYVAKTATDQHDSTNAKNRRALESRPSTISTSDPDSTSVRVSSRPNSTSTRTSPNHSNPNAVPKNSIPPHITIPKIDTINPLDQIPLEDRNIMANSVTVIPSSSQKRTRSRQMRMTSGIAKSQESSNLDEIPFKEIKSITTGIVINSETQQPLAGARIQDTKTDQIVQTDSTGQFIIASTEEETDFQFGRPGFETRTITANGAMRVALHPSESTQMAETVVLSAPSTKSKKTEPLMGERAYRRHINKLANDSNLGKGTVTLAFTVNKLGRPTNIRIRKSGGTVRDRKAVELINNGPDWKSESTISEIEWKVEF